MPGIRFRHFGMAAMTVDPQWTVAQTCVVLWGGNPTAVRERARARKVSAELVLYGCQRALDAQKSYHHQLRVFPIRQCVALAAKILQRELVDFLANRTGDCFLARRAHDQRRAA